MNLPNKLTLLRVVLIPVFVVLLLLEGGQNDTLRIAALIVFCFASFTDFLDGQIARRFWRYGICVSCSRESRPFSRRIRPGSRRWMAYPLR